jgi:hypothetical protein
MSIVDDPLLALIVRFVTRDDGIDVSDQEFARRQLATLKSYVSGYPESERSERAMEWVEQHAESYRRDWQKKVVSHHIVNQRCPDCPLQDGGDKALTCVIHKQWLQLLNEYLNDEIDSRKYVADSLELLREHKNELKLHQEHLAVEKA